MIRQRVIKLHWFFFLVFFSNSSLFAQPARTHSKNRIKLGEFEVYNSSNPQESYNRARYMLKQWEVSNPANRATECLSDKGFHTAYDCIFLPPLPLYPGPSSKWEDSWWPVTESRHYADAVIRWLEMASEEAIFNCQESQCEIITYAVNRKVDGQILARCHIDKVNEILGGVYNCTAIAIIQRKQTWVRVLVQNRRGNATMGQRDFDLGIIAPPQLTDRQVINALQSAMAGHPLRLETVFERRSLLGVASFRVSPVLTPWRERITIRVETDRATDPNARVISYSSAAPSAERKKPSTSAYGISISTTLSVNRQNTTREIDWHQPTKQQEDIYLRAIKNILQGSLQALCKEPKWVSNILFCDVATTTELPKALQDIR